MKTKKSFLLVLSIFMVLSPNKCQYLEKDDFFKFEKLALMSSNITSINSSSLSYCGSPETVTLFAGKTIDIGKVIIGNDAENLYVTFQTSRKWLISLSHLYVGPKEGIPVTKSGNPIPGHFPFTVMHDPDVTSYTYSISLSDLTDSYVVALHADAVEKDGDEILRNETAWAFGNNTFAGKSWGWFQDYKNQECSNIEEILSAHQNVDNKFTEFIQNNDFSSTLDLVKNWLLSLPYIESVSIINENFEIIYKTGLTSGIIITKVKANGDLWQGGQDLISTNTVTKPDIIAINQQTRGANEILFMPKSATSAEDKIITDMDVFIYEPFENQFDPYDKGDDVAVEFNNSDFGFIDKIIHLKNQECTIVALDNLTDYGFVYIDSHGSQGKWILTGQIVDPENDNYETQITEGKIRIQHNIKYNDEDGGDFQPVGDFYGISDVFITSLSGDFSNSIILNSSCQSTMTTFLSDAFINKGAKTYLGVDNLALASFLKTVSTEFVHNMVINKFNTGEAYANLSVTQDVEPYYANFELVGDNLMHYSDGIPLYLRSVIENATPSILEIEYDLILANIVPDNEAFNVLVNAIERNVDEVAISGTKVLLTLESPVYYGDVITVAYTRPTVNPLQTASGKEAETFSVQSVINNCAPPTPSTYYVSANGNDSNPGTISQPWLTFQHALSRTNAGDIVYFRGGTYDITASSGITFTGSNSGIAEYPIRYYNYPGETPIFDFTSASPDVINPVGMFISGVSYINLKGFEIRNVGATAAGGTAFGIYVDGSNINFENIIVRNIDGAGYSLDGNNLSFINCDAISCYDSHSASPGSGGDGWEVKSNGKDYLVTYKGCRAIYCSASGWDNSLNDGVITYDYCWALSNGKDINGTHYSSASAGDGFKLGSNVNAASGKTQRFLRNCLAVDNYGMGITENNSGYPQIKMQIYNCMSYNNAYGFVNYVTSTTLQQAIYRNNIAYGNTASNTQWNDAAKLVHDHNSWNAGAYSVSDADFISLNTVQLYSTRKIDGSLPDVTFGKLVPGSDLIDAGVNVGLPYSGSAPDIGWSE